MEEPADDVGNDLPDPAHHKLTHVNSGPSLFVGAIFWGGVMGSGAALFQVASAGPRLLDFDRLSLI